MSIYDVVRFEGKGTDWLLYKFPSEEFKTNSKLIVSTGQIAIIVHNGIIEKIFSEGRYTLDTENVPFLSSMIKQLHGGKTPYSMEVYFINKKLKMDQLWGTADPIALLDPRFNIQVHLRARGQYALALDNYQYFFQTLVGTLLQGTTLKFDVVSKYFKGIINQKSRTIISKYITSNKVSYFEINNHLEDLQSQLQDALASELLKFGFVVVTFSVESITAPEEELEKLNEMLHSNTAFDIMGDERYRVSRGYDVLDNAAESGSAATVIGLGLGQSVAGNTNSVIPESSGGQKRFCHNCGEQVGLNEVFCHACGTKLITGTLCPDCHNEVPANAKFCPSCGRKM